MRCLREAMKNPDPQRSSTTHTCSRTHRWAAWLAVTATILLAPSVGAAQSLRCNGALVSKGDSPVSLLRNCGEPIYRQPICLSMLQLGWIATPYQQGNNIIPGPSPIFASQCVPMEEWTYDRGPGAFLGVVRIYNGTIESVRDGDRSR